MMGRTFLLLASVCCAAAATATTIPLQHAQKHGFEQCQALLNSVASFYIKDARHGADSTWNTKATNERLFSSFVAHYWTDGDSHTFIHAVPNAAGSCDAVYTNTYALLRSCNIVREETFMDWKYRGSLNEATILLTNDDGGVDIYLSPQDKGQICLVTRREVIYQ